MISSSSIHGAIPGELPFELVCILAVFLVSQYMLTSAGSYCRMKRALSAHHISTQYVRFERGSGQWLRLKALAV